MNSRHLTRRKRAISEVVGAMLLILIVVIAVGTFAFFLSAVQTQDEDRSSFLSSVADEKLQISNLQFSLNNSLIQYEIYNLSNNTKYYVQMINDTMVDLINEASGMLYHSANLNASNANLALPFVPAFYNSINSSTTATINTEIAGNVMPLWNITFDPPSTPGGWAFRTATWSNAMITVRNLNIQSSGIKAIEVNGNYLDNNWTLLGSNGQSQNYSFTTIPITVPAKQSVNIELNLTYLNIPRTSPMQIVLESSALNFFTTSYGPPSAVIQESVDSENYLITSRDVPMFSGSDSAGSNGSFIQQYIWQIDVPESTVQPGWTWSSVGSLDTSFAYGQSFQYRPESFFTSPQLVGSTSTTLVDSSAHFTSAQVGEYLTYTSGPAANEPEQITGYTSNTLTTAGFIPAPDTSGDTYMVTPTPTSTVVVASGTTNTITITGPFRVTLTTVDQYGFMTTSQSTVFNNDTNIAPPGSLSAVQSTPGSCGTSGSATVTVTMKNIFGQPAVDVPVVFLGATSGVIPSTSFASTGSNGEVSISVTCPAPPPSGTLEVESGNLPPVYLPLS